MPSVYDLKPRFQNLLRPLMRSLARLSFTPNAITLIAVCGSLAVGAALPLARRRPALLLLLPAWLLARMALNALDGMMARELSMATRGGAVLNEVGDIVSDLGLYIPLAIVHPPALWPAVAFSIGALLTEFCGLLGQALASSRRYEGPMGKSDRAFVVGALALVTGLAPSALALWPWVLGACALLTVVTSANRIRSVLPGTSAA
jgi:CDP-diacylglycerol--glycerol-3-phosphate 3-phosphatidyltransferase